MTWTLRLAVCLVVLAGSAFAQSYRYRQVTIAADGNLSGAANLGYCSPVRLEVPTIVSASLTFQLSEDGVTYRNLYDEFGTEVTVTASTGNRIIRLNPSEFWNTLNIKIRSGTAASPVTQTSAVTIGIVCQMVYPQ
jgi:hypothetical protein